MQPLANVHETKWTPRVKRESDVGQSYTSSVSTNNVSYKPELLLYYIPNVLIRYIGKPQFISATSEIQNISAGYWHITKNGNYMKFCNVENTFIVDKIRAPIKFVTNTRRFSAEVAHNCLHQA